MASESLNPAFRETATAWGITITDEMVDALAAFEEDLYQTNEVVNLTRVPRELCWVRHFLDSLTLVPLIGEASSLLDIGTGPGFPAWPIALVCPNLEVMAADSNGKMLGFLARHPLPNLTTRNVRVEDSAWRERFDIVSGRAVAPLAGQLEISASPCRVGGRVISMRTAADTFIDKVEVLGLELEETVQTELPAEQGTRSLPIYRKFRSTHVIYPRPWGKIKAAPLF
ncbi:MAG: 16S rRNA (guanine(527)-N(7))-methyltransferase RsmG [Fimbriimonas sp.]